MLYERYKVRIVYERFASSSTDLYDFAAFARFRVFSFFLFLLPFILPFNLSLSLVFFIKIILIIITARDYYYDQTK